MNILSMTAETKHDAGGNMILSNLIFLFENQRLVFLREESVYNGFGIELPLIRNEIEGI